MKKLFLLLLLLNSCGDPYIIVRETESRIALKQTDEEIIDSLIEAQIMENPDFFTDEELLQYFLLADPTFHDPEVTSIGD